MYCSLIALLVIFCALNFALSISFIANISPLPRCFTNITFPNAPSPIGLISSKSSNFTFTSLLSASPPVSSSSFIEFRNARLKAPIPALSMKDEMPQLVTGFNMLLLLLDPKPLCCRAKNFSSTSGESCTKGTWCSSGVPVFQCGGGEAEELVENPEPELVALSMSLLLGVEVADISTPPTSRTGLLPASACLKISVMAHSGLSRSKPNLSEGAQSAAHRPALFLILMSTVLI
mmetsp:Transcript_64973/g.102962  ORF Transcript_64973/g.102962 Transcript_64973/m.102962 type:complete len:233 (+) Transcript_64973:810-1508(+)